MIECGIEIYTNVFNFHIQQKIIPSFLKRHTVFCAKWGVCCHLYILTKKIEVYYINRLKRGAPEREVERIVNNPEPPTLGRDQTDLSVLTLSNSDKTGAFK